MDFYIKKNSTLPEFQIEISKNGRSDYERNQNLSEITSAYISVINPDNGQYIVASKNCVITQSASTTNPTDISYYLNYQFTNRETSRIGKFEIQGMIFRILFSHIGVASYSLIKEYIDTGSSLDIFVKGRITRPYQEESSNFKNQKCSIIYILKYLKKHHYAESLK